MAKIDSDDVEILSSAQLGDGTVNDNPDWVFSVRLPDGVCGWIAGPHGVSVCAITDWLRYIGEPSDSREAAIAEGCDGV